MNSTNGTKHIDSASLVKHTPGPWKPRRDADSPHHWTVRSEQPNPWICHVTSSIENRAGDTRLIALAPEMESLLKDILTELTATRSFFKTFLLLPRITNRIANLLGRLNLETGNPDFWSEEHGHGMD